MFRSNAGTPNVRGLHSLCSAGSVDLIDGKKNQFALWHGLRLLLRSRTTL